MKTGYKVCDVMTTKPISVSPETTLQDCAKIMAKEHIGSLLVKKGNQLAGIMTEQDIVRKTIALGKNPLSIAVKEIMVKEMLTVSPGDDIYDALVKMRDTNIRHLPVMDKKSMVGFLTIKDVLKVQPQLFDLIVEKFEVREINEKPAFREAQGSEGVCQSCGNYAEKLFEVGGTLMCENCREEQEG